MSYILKAKSFSRWARKERCEDIFLLKAIEEMNKGIVEADLGGGLYKKRVAMPGKGKSGSWRVVIATKKGTRWFFLLGYSKNEIDNISEKQLSNLKTISNSLLNAPDELLNEFILSGKLEKVEANG